VCGILAAVRQADQYVGREILSGQFRIVERIGSGGMGAVYKAQQPSMDRHVAVKILHSKFTNRKDLVSRFSREARAMSHLTHPNTAKVFLYGQLEDGSCYIVMEHLEGKNLGQLIRHEGPMEPTRAIGVLLQACAALQEAHDKGIVHRDLKPENIFLSNQGGITDYVKVLDFGLAKVTEREMRPGSIALTQEGMVFGTPEFMSPEQAQGKKLTPASDIYSLAVILYEALTGKLPFDGKTNMDFIQAQVMQKPLSLAERAPDKHFPPLLQKVFDKALAKDPGERFQSALDFSSSLEAVLAGKTELPAPLAPSMPLPVSTPSAEPNSVGLGSPDSLGGPSSAATSSQVGPSSAMSPKTAPTKASLPVGMLVGVAVTFLVVGVLIALGAMWFFSAK
jgi:serine/threonine protein kinase